MPYVAALAIILFLLLTGGSHHASAAREVEREDRRPSAPTPLPLLGASLPGVTIVAAAMLRGRRRQQIRRANF